MGNILGRQVIEQFTKIVETKAIDCCVKFDRDCFDVVIRELVDSKLIEIFIKKCCLKQCLVEYILAPNPLIIIDYSALTEKELHNKTWIRYLELKAVELLAKVQSLNHQHVINLGCTICKCEHKHKDENDSESDRESESER